MERAGVSLLKLDDAQSELLGPLLATALSPEGLLAARGVMKHENILRRVETEAGVANASRRDPGLYYTSIFGKPAAGARLGLAIRRTPPVDQRHRAARRSRPSSRRCSWARIPRACSTDPMPAFDCWPPRKTWGAS